MRGEGEEGQQGAVVVRLHRAVGEREDEAAERAEQPPRMSDCIL
jgi:hypothetical protein